MFLTRFFSSSSHLPSLLLPLILVFTTTSHSAYTTISSAAELKGFAEEVNGGSGTYTGSTVTLESDIDMDGVDFTPIGNYIEGFTGLDFRGVFEGNGYVIRNMNLTSSSLIYMGLFGYTFGCTIKDVVIDSSCSVTTHFVENDTHSYGFVGGIIGYTDTGTGVGEIRIQNCVNMGTIKGTEANSILGGIAGMHSATRFTSYIINCVNLGEIVYSGTAAKAYVGGIVGWMTATNDGIFSSLANCVNLKTLTLTNQPTNAGAIVGFSDKDEDVVQNNYWLEGTAAQGYTGVGTFSDNEAFDSDYKLSSGASLVDSLNSYISSQPSSLGLRKAGTVTFNTNGGLSVSTRTSVLVMLGTPETPTKTGYILEGWYTDPGFNNQWASTTLFDGDATLYAKWRMNQYTVFFNTNGGSSLDPITGDYLSNITLDIPNRTGYTFASWVDDKGNTFTYSYTMNRAENVTLTAHWTPNNYTVIFDFGNGTVVEKKTLAFNETIVYPENLTMEGYTFLRWNNTITKMPAYNLTIAAQWNEIPTEFVEIIFGKKEMDEKEIRDFISDYTQDENYEIKIFDPESNEVTVIVKFVDVNEAKNFVETIKASSNKDNIIHKIGYTQGIAFSFSTTILISFHLFGFLV